MEPVHLPIKTKDANKYVKPASSSIIDSKDNVTTLESLRKLISESSGKGGEAVAQAGADRWQAVLAELLQLLCASEDAGCESALLAAHAYLSLRRALLGPEGLEALLLGYLGLRSGQVVEFRSIFLVYDLRLFKLLLCHGFLQLGAGAVGTAGLLAVFRLAQPDCLRYSRHTCLAFRVLQLWMRRALRAGLWAEPGAAGPELEERLEAVVFSNWDNALCRAGVLGLFGAYLEAMRARCADFLPYVFRSCVERVSWCHVSKYAMLAEICAAMEDAWPMTEPGFVSCLFNSLTSSHLCNASSKLYAVLSVKLSTDAWRAVFGEQLRNYVVTWESEQQYGALQVLCKCWVEPTVKARRELLGFLLECSDEGCSLFRSHLLRIAGKYGLGLRLERHEEQLAGLLGSEQEFVRLNAFAALCYDAAAGAPGHGALRRFLYLNASASTSHLRENALRYFRLFLVGLLRRACLRERAAEAAGFLEWLHRFQLDCFEVGACYQRKLFGLQTYRTALQLLQSNDGPEPIALKDPGFREVLRYGPRLAQEMRDSGRWGFTSKESVVALFRLVLDPASDVRETAAAVILGFFDADAISDSEKMTIFATALSKCNSHKFFETESGAQLFKILARWLPLGRVDADSPKLEAGCRPHSPVKDFQTYSGFLLGEASHQLALARKDIFKAATQNAPFYGVVAALLQVGFGNGPEAHLVGPDFLEDVVGMAEAAVQFFLNAFSAKSANLEHSSSFEEMGLAIDEAIKNSEINYEFDELALSPAQQTIITCIWRSLKILCELAVGAAKNEHATDSTVRRASDLIVTVSVKCRHKGAIEAAGVAAAHLTRYLSRRRRCVELLENHLKRLLSHDFSAGANLTRRGAGLTILFHKIVAGDARPERPLLHLAVKSLLHSLGRLSATRLEHRQAGNYDDPCAMRLHFLKSLVADRQLQAQLSPYLERVCLVCFEHMGSEVFVVRNASYQLFGALVTRLVGQNSGARSADFGYGHSVNHFVTHFPQLAGHVLLSLQACCQPEGEAGWRSAASAIPALALLSKMFFAGCELVDGPVPVYVARLRACLRLFLASPVAHVRGLAAKCLAASVGLAELGPEARRLQDEVAAACRGAADFNRLNGCLLALERLHERLADERRSTSVRHAKVKSPSEVRRNLELRAETQALWECWSRRAALAPKRRLCYAVEARLLRLSRDFRLALKPEPAGASPAEPARHLEALFEKTRPGFFEFVDELMQLLARHVSGREELASAARAMLGARCLDFGLGLLGHAAAHGRGLLLASVDFAVENFERCPPLLLEAVNAYANEAIRSIVRGGLVELQYIDISKLKSFAARLEARSPGQGRTAQLSELLTLVHVLSLRGSGSYDLFEDLMSCVSKERITLAGYFGCPEATRQLVARALEILLCNFGRLAAGGPRLAPLLASLVLLKDEVDSVRETVLDSLMDNVILPFKLSKVRATSELVQHLLMLDAVCGDLVLGELSYEQTADFFGRYLSTIETCSGTADIENPFDDDNITPYKEDSKLVNLVVLCLEQKLSRGAGASNEATWENISESIFDAKNQLLGKMSVDPQNLESTLSITYDKYLAQKLQVVNKVYLKRDC